jgi:hypothetical protein
MGAGPVVDASWNGATDVARWLVLGGSSPESLEPVATAAWNGLATAIPLAMQPQYVQVVAENAAGRRLGASPVAGPVTYT